MNDNIIKMQNFLKLSITSKIKKNFSWIEILSKLYMNDKIIIKQI